MPTTTTSTPAAATEEHRTSSEPLRRRPVEPVVREFPGDQLGERASVSGERGPPPGGAQLAFVLAHQSERLGPVPQLPDRIGAVLARPAAPPSCVPTGHGHQFLHHGRREVTGGGELQPGAEPRHEQEEDDNDDDNATTRTPLTGQ